MYISICNNEIHILYVKTRYPDVTLKTFPLAWSDMYNENENKAKLSKQNTFISKYLPHIL